MTSTRRRLVGNSLALLANQITQNATSFLLSITIARVMGPYTLGQYTLAFTYYFIFMTISSQGMKTLLTRELARHPDKVQTCLVSGTLLQMVFSGLGYGALVGLVLLLPYRPATTVLCCIVGIALIPYGISNVTEAIFQSQDKMHLIAISTVPIYILRLIVMFVLIKLRYSINVVGLALALSEVVILLIEWAFIFRLLSPIRWQIDRAFIAETARAARTFLAIEGVAVIKMRMQILILSLLAGETIVGLYGAATQLLQPFQLISQSLAVAALPTMSRAAGQDDKEPVRRLAEKLIAALLLVAVPLIVGFFFIGAAFLVFMYSKRSFADAGLVLGLVSLTMIPLSFTRVLSYLMMANRFERVNLRTVTINTVLGAILGVILIFQFQSLGAAIAAVVVEVSGAVQFIYAVRGRLFTLRYWNIIRLPLLAGLVMGVALWAVQSVALPILVTLILVGLAYVTLVGGLVIQLFGLKDAIRARLLRRAAVV